MLGLFGRLFGNKQSLAANHANSLTALAQILVAMTIASHLKATGAGRDQEYKIAAAWANHLFGREASASHADLDLAAEHARALRWLDNAGRPFEDLIIQGLRIISIVNSARNRKISPVATELLEKYGQRHPDGPDLDKYSAGLLALTRALEPDQFRSVQKFIGSGPYAQDFKSSKYFRDLDPA